MTRILPVPVPEHPQLPELEAVVSMKRFLTISQRTAQEQRLLLDCWRDTCRTSSGEKKDEVYTLDAVLSSTLFYLRLREGPCQIWWKSKCAGKHRLGLANWLLAEWCSRYELGFIDASGLCSRYQRGPTFLYHYQIYDKWTEPSNSAHTHITPA
jgi:hypothetical protein